MVETINGLSRLSKQLNEKSNNLNSIIMTVNYKLAKLNLGVEAWLEDDPFGIGDYEEIRAPHSNERVQRVRSALLFGFCKVFTTGKWELSVKRVTLETQLGEQSRGYEEVIDPLPPTPLLENSRNVRINSLNLLPKLLKKLEKEAKTLLGSAGAAEESAAKL